MKKFLIIPAIVLFFTACGGSAEKSITEELNQSWSEMSSSDQAVFCLGYTVLPEDEFKAQAAEKFGSEDAAEAVAWASNKCEG